MMLSDSQFSLKKKTYKQTVSLTNSKRDTKLSNRIKKRQPNPHPHDLLAKEANY